MIRKMAILAGMAIAASAFSVSAAAAAEWGHNEAPLETSTTVSFSGSQEMTSSIGGFSCGEVEEEAKLIPGSEGEITALSANVSSCKGTGGLAGCTIAKFDPTKTPFAMVAKSTSTIGVTGREFDVTLQGAFCPFHQVKVESGEFCYETTKAGTLGLFSITWPHKIYNATTGAFIANGTTTGEMVSSPYETYELL